MRHKHQPWLDGEIATLRRMAGVASIPEIAAQLGRSASAVQSTARKHSISLRRTGERHPRAKYRDADVAALRAAHLDGVRPKELEQRFPQFNRNTIFNFICYVNRTES